MSENHVCEQKNKDCQWTQYVQLLNALSPELKMSELILIKQGFDRAWTILSENINN